MEVTNIDERGTFKGNDEQLCNCIDALIELNDERATTPPVPAMAVSLLIAASDRLSAAHATIHQLGENAAKAAREYADNIAALRGEVERLRNHADMLAQLLAKACGDISALLIFGSREGDIRPWTAEYTQAVNVHDAHFAPAAALASEPGK